MADTFSSNYGDCHWSNEPFENKVGAIFSIITTAGKMIPIAAIIIFGLFWGHQDAFGQTVTEIHQSTGGFGVAVLATFIWI